MEPSKSRNLNLALRHKSQVAVRYVSTYAKGARTWKPFGTCLLDEAEGRAFDRADGAEGFPRVRICPRKKPIQQRVVRNTYRGSDFVLALDLAS